MDESISSSEQSARSARPTGGAPTAPSHSASSTRIRRRNRMITSCLECRRRKLKCDKLHPCTNCSKFARDCVFLAPALDSASQLKLTEIKEKMGSLEHVLEQDVARKRDISAEQKKKKPAPRRSRGLPGEEDSDETEDLPVPEDERDLEPTPLAVVDAAYEDDADDDMLDLGIKLGKMRLTDRIGGFFRPKMADELSFTLNDTRNDHRSPQERASMPQKPVTNPELLRSESFLAPGPTYIAPHSGFFFGNSGSSSSLMDYLPSKLAADRLLQQYHEAVHPIARVVHWPSFQVQYENFWTEVSMGIEPTGSLQAMVFAVMFSAVVSMSESDVMETFGTEQKHLISNFQLGTETALAKANFLRTTKVETLQALVAYMIPMCRNEMSRAHSALVGAAIRLAECMGLHRDPSAYGLPPIETHVRRMIWCQLCFLDIRTCENQGPRPSIRRNDFDTQFPLNINDHDLTASSHSRDLKESDGWTDMTLSRIRWECNEMHRVMWVDRTRLEKKQVTLTHVLGKWESFRKAMHAKYDPVLSDDVPIQRATRLVMSILTTRLYIGVLHRYHNSVSVRIPDRLRQIILTMGTQQIENAMTLETTPELRPWVWYAGAIQQWHTAFLLLVEIYSYPMRREADRIWKVLDYVFETDPSLTRPQKGRIILTELRDKTGMYRDVRKIRAPIGMMERLLHKPPRRPGESTNPNLPMNSPQTAEPVPTTGTLAAASTPSGIRGVDVTGRSVGSASGESEGTVSPPTNVSWGFDSPSTMFAAPMYAQQQQQQQQQHRPSEGAKSEGGSSDSGSATFNFNIYPSNSVPEATHGSGHGARMKDDLMMVDIDWDEWDKLFPPEVNTGELNMPMPDYTQF